MVIDKSSEHPSKQKPPIVVVPELRVTSASVLQFWNAFSPTDTVVPGIEISVRTEQFLKAELPNEVRLSPNDAYVSLIQFSNADVPINLVVLGNLTAVRALQSIKEKEPIDSIPSLNSICVMLFAF